jgi:hypothetical protein
VDKRVGEILVFLVQNLTKFGKFFTKKSSKWLAGSNNKHQP